MSTSPYPSLATPRLRLEPCELGHLDGLQAVDGDPQVMRFITGSPETRDQTRAVIERVQARWARWGHSWWTFIALDTNEVLGAGCIQHLRRGGDEPDPGGRSPTPRRLDLVRRPADSGLRSESIS